VEATVDKLGGEGETPLVTNNRILIVDDNVAIHEDFRKVLGMGSPPPKRGLSEKESALFGSATNGAHWAPFELDSAHQGEEAAEKVRHAVAAGRPYALAFVDMRMPPGWDGLETIAHLWQADPELQVVICTAYSDYSWEEMTARVGASTNLVVLKKPFDNVEILQLAHVFTRKWELNRQARLKMGELTTMVAQRTSELESANKRLKHEAEERLELERQFRQAQKMEAVGQLAAGVAHDFNNILTVIHGHASMLLMKLGEDGPHLKSVSEIRQSAERAANLVRQLLTFSRKQIMHFRSVELGEVICSISGMLRELVGEHITLETECAVGLPAIYADRGMLEQVIVNLAVNSRDAMERGGRLNIKSSLAKFTAESAQASPEARPGTFVCLTVSDTGCGIDPKTLGHLFEPFFTTKEIGKGTGLGLATVYGIVKQHQGWIQVQSELGTGTTFEIFFPVTLATGGRVVGDTDQAETHRGTETILIAEDEPKLREMVCEVLSLHGYKVLSASSGPAAIEMWRRENGNVDLLLTDMVMPGGMMGTDLVAELTRCNAALKVIYTTGYSPGSTGLQEALHRGVKFLPKPYSPHKLAGIIRRCLDSSAAK
jgi:signal transduction histidine kinase